MEKGGMEVDVKVWEERKEEFRRRLFEDLEIGYLDRDIMDVLLKLFESGDYFTQSSCSGRITAVDAAMPWEREDSTVIFKKHSPITVDEVRDLLNKEVLRTLWLVVTGPIIHVNAKSMQAAMRILELGRRAGLKHSGIISSSRKGVIVELTSGVFLATPLKTGKDVVIASVEKVVSLANKALVKGKERLNRLREVLGLEPLDYVALWSCQKA
ncbi:MAG: hypothetical protein J7L55_01345 [Desulfurococcales archaeon]|nr:hypothetical protein [Desulfurococcales archaeon]